MRIGSAVMMIGMVAFVIGLLYRRSRMSMLSRFLRRFRINDLLMGSGPVRRLFRG